MPIVHVEKEKKDKDGKEKLKVVERTDLPDWGADAALTTVGKRRPRVEGAAKVTGSARYSYDIRLPGQLYARVLRSSLPHARIKRIDTSRAEQLPGVRAVLSSANAPEIEWYDDSMLFDRTVRFIGDEVAAVAADTEEIAQDALRLIEVEYETLPFVVDVDAALKPGAPQLHEDSKHNMVDEPDTYERGDFKQGFREADVIIEQVYSTQTALHNSLEPHGCTVVWEGDQLTMWESTQSVFTVRKQVAEKLGLPEHHVRVIKHHMGGGFGSKQIAWKHTVIAALLAQQAGLPVQLMLDREAENLAAGNRNATRQHVRIGAKRDGTLTAISARSYVNGGAYMVGGESSDVSGIYQGLYRCPNVSTEQITAFTNTGPAVAFRAPGFVEAAFGLESAMDELARELGIDPVELRRRNYTEEDQKKELPYSSPDTLRLSYDRATEEFGWSQKNQEPGTRNQNNPGTANSSDSKRRGVGFAAHSWVAGAGNPPGYAWVKLNNDGTADVITGTQDIGTGTRTGLTLVAAEELGWQPNAWRCIWVTLPTARIHRPARAAQPCRPLARLCAPPPLTPSDSCWMPPRRCWKRSRKSCACGTARSMSKATPTIP